MLTLLKPHLQVARSLRLAAAAFAGWAGRWLTKKSQAAVVAGAHYRCVLQVKCTTHVPQKLTGLISLCTNHVGVDSKCPYSNRP